MTHTRATTYGDYITVGQYPDVSALDRFGDHSDEAIIEWYRSLYEDSKRYNHTKITITGTGLNRTVFIPRY